MSAEAVLPIGVAPDVLVPTGNPPGSISPTGTEGVFSENKAKDPPSAAVILPAVPNEKPISPVEVTDHAPLLGVLGEVNNDDVRLSEKPSAQVGEGMPHCPP